MFDIIGPNFATLTLRGFSEAMKIAYECARLIGWAKVFHNGKNVLILRRCPN